MRVIFDYTPTSDGHRLNMKYEELEPDPRGTDFDLQTYRNCFKAIVEYIESNHIIK